ncbi:hypothetical protein B0A50_08738 [Salinomyces thailandicus]|uniref:Uncharacterized protein n=1 Tax=Salinomyces thailandicus TaxID=706561 RepID=A0A4U0TJE6_9PEZI|nr:hypothetical protein B0A50_08738 [Salinomyces thailandica]
MTLLQEDFAIQGLVWAQDHFPSDHFKGLEDDDGSRAIEIPMMRKLRAERVVFERLCLADLTEHLGYDAQTRHFFASRSSPEDFEPLPKSMVTDASPRSSSSGSTPSGSPDVGGGSKAIRKPKPRKASPRRRGKKTWANVASAGRSRKLGDRRCTDVAVKDEDADTGMSSHASVLSCSLS